jgi:hypothetical protein
MRMVERYHNHPLYRQPPIMEGCSPEVDMFHIESLLGKCRLLFEAADYVDREARLLTSLIASSKLVKKDGANALCE